MSEQIKSITQNTLVPIGLVILLMGSLLGGMFWAGKLSERVTRTEQGVAECKTWQSSSPTQYQFETLQSSIDEVKVEIKDLKKGFDDFKLNSTLI